MNSPNGSKYIFPVITLNKLSSQRIELLTKLFAVYTLAFQVYPLSSYRLAKVIDNKPFVVVLSSETEKIVHEHKPTPMVFRLPDPLKLERIPENKQSRQQAQQVMVVMQETLAGIYPPKPDVVLTTKDNGTLIVTEQPEDKVDQAYLSYEELNKIDRLAKLLDEVGDKRKIVMRKK